MKKEEERNTSEYQVFSMDPDKMAEAGNSSALQEATTVAIGRATKTRRRRLAIRRFKEVSCQGLNVSQQNGCKRNSRLHANGVRNVCNCDRKYGAKLKIANNDEASIDSDTSCLLKDEGLQKNGCMFHSSEDILKEEEIEDVKSFITVVGDEYGKQSEAVITCQNGREVCMEARSGADACKECNEGPTNSVLTEQSRETKISLSQSSIQSCIDMNMIEENQDENMGPAIQLDEVVVDLAENMTTVQESSVSLNEDEIFYSDPEKRICPRRCPPSGKLLLCGRRREMEDSAIIVPCFAQLCNVVEAEDSSAEIVPCDLHFFAVYDGHGGSQASNYCATRLHHVLTEELATISTTEDGIEDSMWKRVMSSCFLKMDKEVGGVCPNGTCDDLDGVAPCCAGPVAPENVGTTALVAVISATQIVIANCGDSRAVLSRGAKAIPLSTDHKPNRDDETNRIEAAGGRVIYWDGYRVGGLLAVSRAIGDRYLKRFVVSEPDVLCLQRTEQDECLIMATDGLWDVVSNETACDVARRYLASAHKKNERFNSNRNYVTSAAREDAASASVAALLVKLAYSRGSKDNISVLVVDLKSRLK